MEDFEYKDYFDARLCFRGGEDKVVAILDSYAHNQIDLTDINRVFELYHTKLFFEIVPNILGWSEERYNDYKNRTIKLNNVVHEYFKRITEYNVVEIFNECYVCYWDDFRDFFFKFKIYKIISKEKIVGVLKDLQWNAFQILSDKEFVSCFEKELTQLLEEQEYGLRFVISNFLEEQDKKRTVYIPRSFTIDKRKKLVEDYLNGEDVNPNILQLIVKSKYTDELPITPKMKKTAEKRNTEFWEKNKAAVITPYGFVVSFGPCDDVKKFYKKNDDWIYEYDTGWISENNEYSTLLNNFIYLFEYTDNNMICTYISNRYGRSVFEDLFAIRGRGMYKKSLTFDMLEKVSDMQMLGYVKQLNKLEINIEDIIKWFFENYLFEEFGIKNYTCNMPSPNDSILSKCKTLASAIDGVLSKFKMICDDGEIDVELFKYITDSPRIKDVPSLIKNKYCYIKNEEIYKEMYMVFSSQGMLGYTEKYETKYESLVSLITNEKIGLSDIESYNIESIRWLVNRNVIYLEDDILKCNIEKCLILKEFYENNVISLQHFKSNVLKKMIDEDLVVVQNKLLTKSEYQYFDYLLNNSEFSDGKAIRNRYIHDSIVPDEVTMKEDYNTLLKIMVILIIKINDDFCIYDEVKKNGDFYEL